MLFLVLEGIDGCGKSTQTQLLIDHLSSIGRHAVKTHEPTEGFVGKMIKNILQGEEQADTLTLQMLFIADRADHLNKFVIPNINEGNIVLSDRYFYSTIAFGNATGLDEEWLIDIFGKFLMPNAVFYIDVDPKIAIERLAKRGDRKERHDNIETLTKTREGYIKLKDRYKNYFIIDGNRSIKEVNKDIIEITDNMLQAPVV